MKKLTILLLTVVLLMSSMAGATMAYFNDTITADNVITSGNIQIIQYEQERVMDGGKYTGDLQSYTQYQEIAPLVQTGVPGSGTFEVGKYTVNLRDETAKNYIDKIVTVKNVGVNPAYVRTLIAIPTGGHISSSPEDPNWIHWDANMDGTWSWKNDQAVWNMIDDAIINGQKYDIYVATYSKKLQPGETTSPNLLGFWLDSTLCNNDHGGYFFEADGTRVTLDPTNLEILVATQAAQTTTFSDPHTALDTVFGEVTKDNNPWYNSCTIYVRSPDELKQALSNAAPGTILRLTDGIYELPATLPASVRIVGHGRNIVLNAPASLSASGVEFFNVTFQNDVNFVGNGEFDLVIFQGTFNALFNNPAYITECVFASKPEWDATADAVRDTVIFENCTVITP